MKSAGSQKERDRSKLRKGPFWRKQENAAKHGMRLRGWLATESEADASQIFFVSNGSYHTRNKGKAIPVQALRFLFFYVLLTVYLRIILLINQLNA